MKGTLLTVYYNTPQKYRDILKYDCNRLGLDLHATDSTNENRGYAENLNDLIHANFRDYDVFFLANPDIHLVGIPKDHLYKAAAKYDIWGYGMKQNDVMYYGGEIDKKRMSGALRKEKPGKRFAECDFVSGSFMAVKKEVFEKAGFLDESFFMYYEDVEFCYRARKQGFKIGLDSDQWYEHFESSDDNPKKARWLAKNRMKFLWQHGDVGQKVYEVIRFPKTLLEDGKHLL